MYARIRSGDLKITGARRFRNTLGEKNYTVMIPNIDPKKAESEVMHVSGLYRDDEVCTETCVPPIGDFPERRFWLPQKVIEDTWPMTLECFERDYRTEYNDEGEQVYKERPLVHIEYVADPYQGRIITKISDKR